MARSEEDKRNAEKAEISEQGVAFIGRLYEISKFTAFSYSPGNVLVFRAPKLRHRSVEISHLPHWLEMARTGWVAGILRHGAGNPEGRKKGLGAHHLKYFPRRLTIKNGA